MARSILSAGLFRARVLAFLVVFLGVAVGAASAQDATTTTLSATTPATLGTAATLTATVADSPTPATAPTGTVSFFDGGVLIATIALNSSAAPSTATFASSILTVGSHSITATYNPNDTSLFSTSSATAVSQSITARGTTTAIPGTGTVTVRSASPVAFTVSDQAFGASAGTSTATGNNLTSTRFAATATQLPDGNVLIVGGSTDGSTVTNAASTALASVEIYNPAGGTFTALANTFADWQTNHAYAKGDLILPAVGNPGGFVFEVTTAGTSDPTVEPTWNQNVGQTNPENTGTVVWTNVGLPSLTTARFGHTATLLSNGNVLIAGGEGTGGTALQSTEIYNFSTKTFIAGGMLATARVGHAAVALSNGDVLLFGGGTNYQLNGVGVSSIASAEISTDSGTTFALTMNSMGTARFGLSASLLSNGTVLLAGGSDGTNVLTSTEIFNPTATPSSGTFAAGTGTLNTARFAHTATLLPDGITLIAGGTNTTAVNGFEVYDPLAGSFVAVAATTNHNLASPRTGQTATLLDGGTVLFTGGNDATPATQKTGELYTLSFDPEGFASPTSDNGDDTLAGCSLTLSGTGQTACNGSVTPRHVNGSTTHTLTGHYGVYPDWTANFAYSLDALILPVTGNAGGFIFEATTAGTSAMSTEPTWPQSILAGSNTVNDNSVVWTNVGLPDHSSSDSSTQALTVNAQAITVTAAADTKTYDTTNSSAGTPTITNGTLLGSDTATLTQTFDTKNVGTGKTLTPVAAINDPTDSTVSTGDYTITFVTNATGVINAFALTVTATGVNKVYDTTPTATVTLSDNHLGSDVVTDSDTSATFSDKNVGTGKAVTVSGISISGTDSGNYALQNTTASTTANITAVSLTVTATGVNRVYDTTTAATVTLSDNHLASDVVTDSYTSAAFADKNVGNGKSVSVTGISISGADAGNYTANSTAATTANITAAPLTVTATGVNKVYDTTITATVTLSDTHLGNDAVTDSSTSASFATKTVGNGKTVSVTGISISGADAGNYALQNTTASTTANITPAPLTVTATGVNKVYDATPTATVTLSDNHLGSDVVTDSFSSATFADKNVANGKTVSVTGISISGADAANYTINTTASTTANIMAHTLTVSATASNKVYDSLTTATVALSDNRIGGDSIVDNFTSATFSDKNVGSSKTVTVMGISLSGADANNYTPNTTTTTTANITQAPLTVTATGVNRVYDTTNTATVMLSDTHIGTDVVTDSFTTATFPDKTAGNGKLVSVSGISIAGTDSGNYSLQNTTATTTANITQAALTVSAVATGKVYDTTTTASVTLSDNHLGSDSVMETFVAANFANKNVGNGKTVTVTGISISGADAGNYIANGTAATTANITPANLTVTATGVDKVYDSTVTASVTLSDNHLGSDSVTDSSTTATFATKSVGTAKAISVSGISISGTDAGNYTLQNTTANATANITPASLTVSATGVNKVYDGTGTATVTLSDNRLGSDVVTDSSTSAIFPDKNAGSGRVISVSGISISGTDAGNYTLANTTATTSAGITQRPITVTAAANTKTYDGTISAAASPTVTSGTVVVGDSAALSETYTSKTAGAGKTLVPAVVITDGNGGNNYSVTLANANTGTINPLAINGSITASNKVYDTTTTATISCSPAGVVTGDVVNCAATAANFSDKNVGAGKTVTATGVSLSGADAGNYTLVSMTPTTTASITPAPLTVTAGGISKVYDGTNVATVMLSDNHLGGDVVADNAASAIFPDKNVGSGRVVSVSGISISGTDAGNYALQNVTTTTTANITQRPLTVSATGVSKTYDASTSATVTLSDNRVSGDSLTDSFAGASFASANVGTGIGVAVTGISISGGDANNYTANTTAGASAAITAAKTTSAVTVPVGTNQAEFTFTANVTPQIAGSPTGTVTFMDNGTPLGAGASGSSTVTLTNGTATFTANVNQLAAGTHTITAVYNKDSNFAAASTTIAASVTVNATLSVSPGAPIPSQTITLNNQTAQDITYNNMKCSVLSALGQPVANTLCSPSTSSLTVPHMGSASFTVQLATNSASAQPAQQQAMLHMRALNGLWLAMPAVFFLPFAAPASTRRKLLRRKTITWLGVAVLLVFLMMSMGCGGGGFKNPNNSQPGSGTNTTTQPGSYIVQVFGTGPSGQTSLASVPFSVGF
jgi:hypothetical protein